MSYVKTIIRAIQQWVADKLTEQSEEIRKDIPTDTISSVELEAVEQKIPTDYVNSEQLAEAMEEVKNEIPEGFSGKWDDLEGKPFYERGTLIYEGYVYSSTDIPESVIGEPVGIFSVVFNGVQYNDSFKEVEGIFSSGMCLGNPSWVLDGTEDNGLPFGVIYYPDTEMYTVNTNDGENLVSIYKGELYIESLEKKFLPGDTIFRDDLNATLLEFHTWEKLPDKPFYKVEELLNEGRSAFSKNSKYGLYTHGLYEDWTYIAGSEDTEFVKVILDGVTQICPVVKTAYSDSLTVYTAGNCSLLGETFFSEYSPRGESGFSLYEPIKDTGENFCLVWTYYTTSGTKVDSEAYAQPLGDGTNSNEDRSYSWYRISLKPIGSEFLPKAEAISDVTEAPTAEQFNALLAALRAAGYMAE